MIVVCCKSAGTSCTDAKGVEEYEDACVSSGDCGVWTEAHDCVSAVIFLEADLHEDGCFVY